ncbi:hypothetical protein BCR41DRAFT_99942 [Lobosporangium transversale]|uniref:Fungal lipase-type domain-containing protein n=1 Tax=Lobosporangium transversale TaxID=64571 RepID=A0A1Y2GJ34_9FUNG|nr:hypothetical protein BCR41DRAFT_99942 [Lobosporangium transversale]ORZ12452.1 hypothetical protein BCR41DRAFT_99942 [Lobosporangium transversale]|eukprot:XP_021880071.1 hypothetical protein BCR41DRAFT_99942 [Lobosporangium transversale]
MTSGETSTVANGQEPSTSTITGHAHLQGHGHQHTKVHGVLPIDQYLAQYPLLSKVLKQDQRRKAAPEKLSITTRHLDEFTAPHGPERSQARTQSIPLPTQAEGPTKPGGGILPIPHSMRTSMFQKKKTTRDQPLKKPLSIRPTEFINYMMDGTAQYVHYLLHPSQIPGRDLISRVYAMGFLPVALLGLFIVQMGIGLLVILVNHTRIGAFYYKKLFDDQIALFDETDGNDEAVRQLAEQTPRDKPYFSYHIANLLLIMSSMVYQRDDKLVAQASKILLNVRNQEERDRAAELLLESERVIDENSTCEFGMRFSGISELKTLGGPFAGLFYNDESIVLVFKGTSILAFNEYLLDMTLQRVDASEYLYGEVHKGFYESLFPDPAPLNWYERMTLDKTHPFNTIMETIFETAKVGKAKTGKPVNLWFAGHSLGGSLASIVMGRLQMIVRDTDPLIQEEKEESTTTASHPHPSGTRTVLQEMLARFSSDPDLLVLRDCYSVAAPNIGDSTFAEEFGRNELRYCQGSPYKPAYWRIVADKDIVPWCPPSLNLDPNEPCRKLKPSHKRSKGKEGTWLEAEKEEDRQAKAENRTEPKHMHSLLDYQNIGQHIVICHATHKPPTIKPSLYDPDFTDGVLRSREEVQKLLGRLAQIANAWKFDSGR